MSLFKQILLILFLVFTSSTGFLAAASIRDGDPSIEYVFWFSLFQGQLLFLYLTK